MNCLEHSICISLVRVSKFFGLFAHYFLVTRDLNLHAPKEGSPFLTMHNFRRKFWNKSWSFWLSKKMNNQLTKSNPGSIIEQNQTNVHETPWTWWFVLAKSCRKSPSNKGKQTPLAKSERPMLKNIKTNPNPNPSFGSIRQGSTLKNLVILRSNFCIFKNDWLTMYETATIITILPNWVFSGIEGLGKLCLKT